MRQWDSQDAEGGDFPTLLAEFGELRNLKRPCPRARLSPYESDNSVQFSILVVVEQRGVGREGEGGNGCRKRFKELKRPGVGVR